MVKMVENSLLILKVMTSGFELEMVHDTKSNKLLYLILP